MLFMCTEFSRALEQYNVIPTTSNVCSVSLASGHLVFVVAVSVYQGYDCARRSVLLKLGRYTGNELLARACMCIMLSFSLVSSAP